MKEKAANLGNFSMRGGGDYIGKESVFAENLRVMRRMAGKSQQAVGLAINVSRSAISNYESGSRMPSHEILALLAKFYGVSVGYLFGEEGANCFDEAAKVRIIGGRFLDISPLPPDLQNSLLSYFEFLYDGAKKRGRIKK